MTCNLLYVTIHDQQSPSRHYNSYSLLLRQAHHIQVVRSKSSLTNYRTLASYLITTTYLLHYRKSARWYVRSAH